jgi:cyclophilin family peptidyl-prolyl cis-trans isomerase
MRAALVAALVLAATLAGCSTQDPLQPRRDASATTGPATTTAAPATTSRAPAPTVPSGADPCASASRTGLPLVDDDNPVVAISTSKGCIVAELREDKAPITVANFRTYVEEGFYTGLLFHRIYEDFMLQTGGMQKDGTMKEGTHPPIQNEARTSGLRNLEYTLSMARTPDPHSATNQFFINTADNDNLDPGAYGDGYAVFGMVVAGRDVVDAIEATPTTWYTAGSKCQPDQMPSCPTEEIDLLSMRML